MRTQCHHCAGKVLAKLLKHHTTIVQAMSAASQCTLQIHKEVHSVCHPDRQKVLLDYVMRDMAAVCGQSRLTAQPWSDLHALTLNCCYCVACKWNNILEAIFDFE